MSQQGGRPARPEDDWWGQLYDDSTPDTGPTPAPDTLDDRFASARNTVTGRPHGSAGGGGGSEGPGAAPPPPVPAPRAPSLREAKPGPPEPPLPALRPAQPPPPPWPPVPTVPPRADAAGAARGAGGDDGVADAVGAGGPGGDDGVDPYGTGGVEDLADSGGSAGTEPGGVGPSGVAGADALADFPGAMAAPADPRGAAAPDDPPGAASRADRPENTPPSPPPENTPPSAPPENTAPSARPGAWAAAGPAASSPPAAGADSAAPADPRTAGVSGPGRPVGGVAWSAAAGTSGGGSGLPSRRRGAEAARGEVASPDPGSPRDAAGGASAPEGGVDYVGSGPPTYDPEPTALPAADPDGLGDLVSDTVLEGARYGACAVRAVSLRGDSGRYRGEPRRDALLVARFGSGDHALVLVAMATGARAASGAHLAAAEACRWIGQAVGRSHQRLGEDIRAGRRGELKSGLHRLTDRSLGRLRATADERGVDPEQYGASLRCLLLPADPDCRTRVFFGVGEGGLFRLRDGVWQDIEPQPVPAEPGGAPVVGFGSPPAETPEGDRLTLDLGIPAPPRPFEPAPAPPREPFRFRASLARPGDALVMCTPGLADPLRGEPALCAYLARRWSGRTPPGLAAFLADAQVRVKGYADDRTAAAVWEA
ncbi:protein phosphatase 2C domain-containing protein [Streptomyces sp. LP11]|uniref:Protein phosphatase 2C domain-containing protein n=2 Tax=Streptomyces pyxinicus TaxID=2970331 RepID=A0ABT2B0S2_9ACTN|nr:protein phosphatase 2C domain-containing protein [Streptomyces sp. LP11]MCS0602095.1 protein phosphatase 2C domain-containing protein [Streptomyces sp. LP11]